MHAVENGAAEAALPILSIESLSKRYGDGPLVVDEVSLTLRPGEIVAMIGASGAGKSTLLRCVNRLVEPSAGRVIVDGGEVGRASGDGLRRVRRGIGMIFQEYALVERLSVMENVLSGRLGYVPFWRSFLRRFRDEDVARAFGLLDRVGLGEFADQRADALSGGQRQRVGIARALAQEPRLLLVDEPTASLDPKSARQILRLIREICRERGLTALINIHDVELARLFSDRVLGLRQGRLVFDSPPSDLTAEALTAIYGAEDWSLPAGDMRQAQAEGNGDLEPATVRGMRD